MSAAPWDRVKKVFQEALARPPHERADCLQELCGEDRVLRAEVESLIATHEEAGSFGERPAIEVLGQILREADNQIFGTTGGIVQPGDRLGVYEIEALVGTGGMGEVYKARDTRLDRTVAIKLLPPQFAADRDRFHRFDREARAVARLDHPHIGALYDVGRDGGRHFLVMQYLEGETLAARLTKGPLPLDQVLRCAIEIADALDHAHRRGIVHRDLKPGNVVLAKSGAKLLDFGLAKWRGAAGGSVASGLSIPAAGRDSLTDEGLIVGTLHYMAPEQVEGGATDARTDLFAFGAVVYEMVTGHKAFDGRSPASVMAAILGGQPPALSFVQPLTPPALDQLVKTCLAKEPDERWQSAADVSRQLRWIAESSAQPSARSGSVVWRRSRRAVVMVSLVSLLAGGVIGVALWSRLRGRAATQPVRVTRSILSLPRGAPFESFALSPDGIHVAYVAIQGDGRYPIYVQALNELDARPIAGTENACCPFFSPDGQWIGFSDRLTLKKVAVSGGAPQTICDLPFDEPFLSGVTWGADDTIVFSPRAMSGLYRVAATGGTPQVLTTPGPQDKSHRAPRFLPGGKAVLFTIVPSDIRSFDEARIAVLSLETGQARVLVEGGTDPVFVATGHLIYVRGSSLIAVPFDPHRLEITGPPSTVLDGVSKRVDNGLAQFRVAESGLLAYVRGGLVGSDNRVVWVDRLGRTEPLIEARRAYQGLRLSPDGRTLALEIAGANDQIWLYDLVRRTLTQLTFAWDNVLSGQWTPDGRRIAFLSNRAGGPHNFYWQPVDGSGPAERLTEGPYRHGGGSWSPDGKLFTYVDVDPTTRWDIWLLAVGPERRARPLIQRPFRQWFARLSPDGRWLAYASDETGRPEVYLQPFPGLGVKWQVSNDGGNNPQWERQGRELYYRNARQIMAVSIQTQPTFSAAAPRQLFASDLGNYEVAPDGRFIMIELGPSAAPPTQITLVQHWFEELTRLVPTK
jgi:serine/threonine protein kinase/Tol biopolymer transport system component